MEEIITLTEINFSSLFIQICAIVIGLKVIVSAFEWLINKLGLETRGMREKRQEHELLIQTTQNVSNLQKKHDEDMQQSNEHDKKIENELSLFMKEIRDSISQTQNDIKVFADNRKHDREQSFQIQQELTNTIQKISNHGESRDLQINSLTIANRELLAGKINDKYKHYISIGGIPEDEVDEFTSLHKAYNACGGNHHGDAKYNYIIEHLPVIPVEVRLVYTKGIEET